MDAFLSKVNDPALGAYFMEELTNDMAQLAWANFQDIEREGGFLIALKNNTIASLENLIECIFSKFIEYVSPTSYTAEE